MLCSYFHSGISQDLVGHSGKIKHTLVYIWDCVGRQFHQTAIGLVTSPSNFSLESSACFGGYKGYLQVIF